MVTAIEHDATAAYLAMIERLESLAHKAKVTESRGDHKRHLRELHDRVPPARRICPPKAA